MKESKKIKEFMDFWEGYKLDLEKDMNNYGSMKPDSLQLIHDGYDAIKYDIYRHEDVVKGALQFLHDMGYVEKDKYFELFCNITNYYSAQYKLLTGFEDRQFRKFLADLNQKPLEA